MSQKLQNIATQQSQQTVSTPTAGKTDYPLKLKIVAIFLQASSSILINVVNKSLYQNHKFKSPMDLLLFQCICNIIFCFVMMTIKTLRPSSFQFLTDIGFPISNFSEMYTKLKYGLQCAAANLVVSIFGLYSVKHVSIPIYLTFRRCAALTTIVAGYLLQGTTPHNSLWFPVFLLVTGSIWETLDAQWFGYFLVWMNNITQSFQTQFMNLVKKKQNLTPFDMGFYFCVLTIPLLLGFSLYTGEFWYMIEPLYTLQGDELINFYSLLLLSGLLGIFLTLFACLAYLVCEPLTVNVAGILKDVVLTYLGFLLFTDSHKSLIVAIGLGTSFLGGTLYMYRSYSITHKPKLQ
eukprot:403345027